MTTFIELHEYLPYSRKEGSPFLINVGHIRSVASRKMGGVVWLNGQDEGSLVTETYESLKRKLRASK